MEKSEIIVDTSGSMGNSYVDLKKETTKFINDEITTIGKEVEYFIQTDFIYDRISYYQLYKAVYIAVAKSLISDIVDIHNCKIDYIYQI